MPSTTPPSACRHCGIDHHEHMQRWTSAAGWHQWTQPTQQQVKQRMTVRRKGRTTSR
ncbi:hypothetical protein [Streptomyces sp. NBC_01264]|uniref:hypothetical protein n=1 Tax=Streptomyces sp. NBC_01264 TaxID=2903804 RepID=UPI00225B3633|nr:hypothetical protein [Streptomyces sp. NBC_01264]MCX4784054.1 hypothetical protein [Streptomyces sp. NBC_01264]